MRPEYETWMRLALSEARTAPAHGDVPIGAVVVDAAGEVIGRGANAREVVRRPDGARRGRWRCGRPRPRAGQWRLSGCTLVVTLEPCTMCAGAATLSRVDRVVFGAWNPELGAAGSLWDVLRDRRLNHRPEVVGGVLEADCSALLAGWFAEQRAAGRGDGAGF